MLDCRGVNNLKIFRENIKYKYLILFAPRIDPYDNMPGRFEI